MKSSCITHPANEPLIIVRRWQLDFCNGDGCAASLISFFEYWHNIKTCAAQKARASNDVAEMHGDTRTQDETVVQFHSEDDLEKGLLLYGRTTIAKSLKQLEEKGVIEIMRNPNPRYKFDRTRHFVFHPSACQQFLDTRTANIGGSTPKTNGRRINSGPPRSKNNRAIPDTTADTSSKTTTWGEVVDEEEREYTLDRIEPLLISFNFRDVLNAGKSLLSQDENLRACRVFHAVWVLAWQIDKKNFVVKTSYVDVIEGIIRRGVRHPVACPTPSEVIEKRRLRDEARQSAEVKKGE